MAAKPFSKEQLNFFKFSTLVLDEFPKVLRQIFITMWDSKVAIRPGFITWDDGTKVRNMLLTSEGGKTDVPTTKSIEEWDCTALFKATIYAKTFGLGPGSKGTTLNNLYLKKMKPSSGSFHSSVQSSTGNQDETCALAIDQLRLLRNTLCHSHKSEIIKSDFDNYVLLVTNALSAVNTDTAFVDVIGQMSEDDFPTEKVQELHECRVKELQAISMFHANMEQKLSSIEEQTEKIENVEQKLSSMEEQINKMENVEQKISSVDEKVEKMMSNISLGEKANVPDTLPNPHIPSSVPLFTGREVEIKEITKAISDQSTRLLNIWGSPGFGKTSTAIEVAHHLLSLGYPVYFFKLQSISTVDEFLSKILSIFKSNLVDLSLTPLDKLVSIFREISSPIILVFDNLDDLLSSGTSPAKLTRLFEEFLDSSVNINILFTTRELLESLRDEVKGFQDLRIRPLSSVSSVEFVRQLIPSFSKIVVAKVAEISSHVPLAMKLVASLVKHNSEEMANTMLDELKFSENLLEQIDSPYEKKMQNLFEGPFGQLSLSDKHALISLTVFASPTISKDAASNVVSGEIGATVKAVRSLKTLVEKSLIDEDPNGKYYSVHPLIYSFVIDKATQSNFENVFNFSRIRFCRYYLLLFDRLNDDFLAGKSVDHPQLQDTMQYLLLVIYQSITSAEFENSQLVLRILSKSEIFFSLIYVPCTAASLNIHYLYDLAIEKCKSVDNDVAFLKLHVTKYFQTIASSLFVRSTNSDIGLPTSIREKIDQLSDGTAAKLSCYEGIFDICNGNLKNGIQRIEKCLGSLQSCTDHLLLKCLCFQLLTLYYGHLNKLDKSCQFRKMAITVCAEISNCNLFFIDDCDHKTGDLGEPLILFIYLLNKWSNAFLKEETKRYVLNLVYKLQRQKEVAGCDSHYLHQILCYGDHLLAFVGFSETLLDEKIEFLNKSFMGFRDSDTTFPSMSQKPVSMAYSTERLLFCYNLKSSFKLSIEACRNALDFSLQQYGKQHRNTARCYYHIGLAENVTENYSSALDAFDQALEIMLTVSCAPDDVDFLAQLYLEKGKTFSTLDKFESAIASYKEALNMRESEKNNEESEEIAEILHYLAFMQCSRMDLAAALETNIRALHIRKKLFSKKCLSFRQVVFSYLAVGKLYYMLGNGIEGKKCLENALDIVESTHGKEECSFEMTCIYLEFLSRKVDEKVCTELLDRILPVIKEHDKPLLHIVYLKVCSKQLESGKYDAGLASLKEALNIELEDTLRENADGREILVSCYLTILSMLVNIREFKFEERTLVRALQVAESLPQGRKHIWLFRCYCCKGVIHMNKQEYDSAIESFEHALLQLAENSSEAFDKLEESECRKLIAIAHLCQRAYKDALSSLYQALPIMQNRSPKGSEYEANLYLVLARIARIMQNKDLAVSNLRLAYKMFSKVLGEKHPKAQQIYIAYVRALIN